MPAKRQDEERAIAVCRSKVLQHGLQMNVVAAEYQW
jgi:cell fate regulator YaaT (PSP1 superfamily)